MRNWLKQLWDTYGKECYSANKKKTSVTKSCWLKNTNSKMLHIVIRKTFLKWQNYSNGKQDSGCQGSNVGGADGRRVSVAAKEQLSWCRHLWLDCYQHQHPGVRDKMVPVGELAEGHVRMSLLFFISVYESTIISKWKVYLKLESHKYYQ